MFNEDHKMADLKKEVTRPLFDKGCHGSDVGNKTTTKTENTKNKKESEDENTKNKTKNNEAKKSSGKTEVHFLSLDVWVQGSSAMVRRLTCPTQKKPIAIVLFTRKLLIVL